MTRSIFDPGGGETERSGSTFGSEAAGNRSHVPRETVDEVTEEEQADLESADDAGAAPEEQSGEFQKTDPDSGPQDEQRL